MAMYMKPAPDAPIATPAVRLAPAALGAIALTIAAVLLLRRLARGRARPRGQSAATLTQTGLPFAGP